MADADPSTEAALLALETLATIAANSPIRDRIDLARRTLHRELHRVWVLAMRFNGTPRSQINDAEIDPGLAGVAGGPEDFLEGAINGLEYDAVLLGMVGVAIHGFGIAHPDLRSTPRWEACRHDHVVTTGQLDVTIQRLRRSLQNVRASSRGIGMSFQYPPRSGQWAALLAASGQLMGDARDHAQVALQEWNQVPLTRSSTARRSSSRSGMTRRSSREWRQELQLEAHMHRQVEKNNSISLCS